MDRGRFLLQDLALHGEGFEFATGVLPFGTQAVRVRRTVELIRVVLCEREAAGPDGSRRYLDSRQAFAELGFPVSI